MTSSSTPIISAEAHSDDHVIEVAFDATPWFEQASDDEIIELRRIEFGGNLAADRVAEFFRENPKVNRLFNYLALEPTMSFTGDTVGFECHIDPAGAEAWIAKHRPHLHLPDID